MSTKRPWKRFKQDSTQETSSQDVFHNANCLSEWDSNSEKEKVFQSDYSLTGEHVVEEEDNTFQDFGHQSEDQSKVYEETDNSEESDNSSLELTIQAFVEEHSNNLEDLRESLMDVGVFVSLEQLEQLRSEDITALIRDSIYREPLLTYRSKREDLKSVEDLALKLEQASHILVISGAGISVSCGIPDFRSAGGVYERIQETFSLLDPQEIFDLDMFKENPELFYSFAKEIIPRESTEPSLSHRFIHDLETHQKLLRNYAQNIDGLESVAGIDRVVYCHGSFSTAHCLRCGERYSLDDIRSNIIEGKVPYCSLCETRVYWDTNSHGIDNSGSLEHEGKDPLQNENSSDEEEQLATNVIKPDIVFFGESLSCQFFDCFESDREKADLLLVIGTSLQVAPVSKIPFCISAEIPQVLINLEPVGPSDWFDLELIGPCDIIIQRLYQLLGWKNSMNDAQCLQMEQVQPRRFVFQKRDIK